MLLCIIILRKSSLDNLFFVSIIMIISFPTTAINSILYDVTVYSIAFATSSGGLACSHLSQILNLQGSLVPNNDYAMNMNEYE
jgi:hypothetical protein